MESLFDGGIRLAVDVGVGGQAAGRRGVRTPQELVGDPSRLSQS